MSSYQTLESDFELLLQVDCLPVRGLVFVFAQGGYGHPTLGKPVGSRLLLLLLWLLTGVDELHDLLLDGGTVVISIGLLEELETSGRNILTD